MTAFDIVPGLRFVSRAGWGADPRHPRLGQQVARNQRTHVIIHHTVMVDRSDQSPDVWNSEAAIFAMMRSLQICRPDLGLDVPYNFVAFIAAMNGGLYICEGRGEDRSGAHTKGHNTAGIAVSFAGDFENGPVDDATLAARMPLLSKFIGWLRYGASNPAYGQFPAMIRLDSFQPHGRHVFFHQDFKQTECPGRRLKAHLVEVDFVRP